MNARYNSGRGRRWRRVGLPVVMALVVILAGIMWAPAAQATSPLANGGFETGDLSGWSLSVPPGGSAGATGSAFGYGPVDGSYFALLKTNGPGSYTTAAQTFTVNAGDKIAGWAFFKTGDYWPYNDNAHVAIWQGSTHVATVFLADVGIVGDNGSTPWTYWEHIFTAGGTYTVQARVANAFDSGFDSYMGLDAAVLTDCSPVLGWNAPLSASTAYDLPAAGTLDIRFSYASPCTGDHVHDESVVILVWDQANPAYPIAAYTYGGDIAIDDAAGEYSQSFIPSWYGVGAGTHLTVEVYLNDMLAGTAEVRVIP